MVLSQKSEYKRSRSGRESVDGVEGEGTDKGDHDGGDEKGWREDGKEK
jgi:hypothetical protein